MKRKFNGSHCMGYAVIGVVIFFFCAFQNNLFGQTLTREVLRILSDCFTITGILLSGVAAVSWAGSLGTFDMIGYGMKSLFFFIPKVNSRTEKSFYDYRKRKEEKGRRWLPEMLVIGVAFLLCGVICVVVYSLI